MSTNHQLIPGALRDRAADMRSEPMWERELGPLLTSAEVRALLGGISRQRVDELLREQRLIGLHNSAGHRGFPTFQFSDGKILESLVFARQGGDPSRLAAIAARDAAHLGH